MKYMHWLLAFTFLAGTSFAQETITLNKQEKEGLQFMREEEKLARDVYDSMFLKWDVNPFGNIRQSERVHMGRMKDLLDQYKVDDPVDKTKDKPGVFRNRDMQKVFDELVKSGSLSLTDALKAGAKIEELDIADLDERIRQTKNEDILNAYRYLRMGSENHLRAFTRRLKTQGADYVPEHLSRQEFDHILAGENGGGGCGQGNKGNGNGCGQGPGKGQGRGGCGNRNN